MSRIRRSFIFANVVSLLALFIALGGGAYAALNIPANSVGTKQIKNGAVSLKKISASARKSLKGNKGPRGATGLSGPKGDPGVAGSTTAVWTGYLSAASAIQPQSDGHVAKFTFSSPVAGFANVSAHIGVRLHNDGTHDCHIENQLASSPAAPASTAPGYIDDWINANLPTELGGGTFLQLDESVSTVVPVAAGANTVYLNGADTGTGCAALWGPITVNADYQQTNLAATLTAP
jgi:hypothetical protein